MKSIHFIINCILGAHNFSYVVITFKLELNKLYRIDYIAFQVPPIVLSWYSWNCPFTKRNTKLDFPTADSPNNTSLNWQIFPCVAPLGLCAPVRPAIVRPKYELLKVFQSCYNYLQKELLHTNKYDKSLHNQGIKKYLLSKSISIKIKIYIYNIMVIFWFNCYDIFMSL